MMKRRLLPVAAAGLFLLLLWKAPAARDGALWGLTLCAQVLIPSLMPFFVAAGLLRRLAPSLSGGRGLTALAGRLFGVGGAGGLVFLLGLSGGYPLGATVLAELLREGRLTRREGQRLLRFCDNSGPAFAAGALGLGVFGGVGPGLFLWGVHALSAVLTGLLLSFPRSRAATPPQPPPGTAEEPAFALSAALQGAVTALLNICGFVVFFGAALSVFEALGLFGAAAGLLARCTGAELTFCRAALAGLLELSTGVGLMAGLPLTPLDLALGAFLLSWGGLCVHFQSLAVLADAGLKTAERLGGKLLQGALSAVLAYLGAGLFF